MLADLLGITQPAFDSSQQVLAQALGGTAVEAAPPASLSNRTTAGVDVSSAPATVNPVGIYQLDGIVRRAPSLQLTADAREGAAA